MGNVLERLDFEEKKDRLVDEDRSKVERGFCCVCFFQFGLT